MSNVQVAIRVRPLSARETKDGGQIVVQVEDKVVRIQNIKLDGRMNGHGDSREKVTEFGFDYCYWSVDPKSPNHASQEEVFQDLGVSVLAGASEGYNVCLFAYGQTGSGKTYTMMGTPPDSFLQGIFGTDSSFAGGQGPCRVEISFLEIYNERVQDLLRCPEQKPTPLRVREHPEKGPYVQGLSQYVVSDYKQAVNLLEMGIANRITATTHMHDASSRSHAIFSIQYTQAILENNLPSEIVSKINLVDLAGSERADPNYCRDRLTEGSNINKSLVTLGIVIAALAQNSQMFSSSQSINSMVSEGEGSTVGSQSSSLSGGTRRQCFIPYRDSVLTWLLKDSLGGNSKTIMIATISPSCSSYSETLSTLRYAAHARNIVNKPRVNEDANVRLIRELREEIDRLKSMLLSFEMQRNPSPSLSDDRDGSLSDIVLQNELKVEQLTKDWSERWHEQKELLEKYSVDIDHNRAGFLIRSLLPHLIALDRDVLNTGVTFYPLRDGVTKIGPHDVNEEPQIVLQGEARCEILNQSGLVTLKPVPGTVCTVNGREVTESCRLAQGAVITLGDVQKFRFNHPAEAAILRERRRASEGVLGCCSSDMSHPIPAPRVEGDGSWQQGDDVEVQVPRKCVREQQRYVECLREEIQVEQQRADLDLEREQAHLKQQQREIQQWVLQEKQRLLADERRGTEESGVQTDLILQSHCKGLQFRGPEAEVTDTKVGARKRIVHEELMRHHALRRAESRVRRKRLRYQLEKIARKRHLLEAKRELQRLESILSPDGALSPEPRSSVKTREPQHQSFRRHSFSADLLSRLYPKHTPIFSHFLRRNKSLELSSSLWRSASSQKWASDEFLPSRRMRSRANTLPSGSGQSFVARTNSSENLRAAALQSVFTSSGMTEKTNNILIKSRQEEQLQTDSVQPSKRGTKKAVQTFSKSSTPFCPPKISKSFSQGSKSLERIRKVFSQSAGPGIRTALSKLFRKPPSGFVAARGTKSIKNTAGQISGNKESQRSMQLETYNKEKSQVKMALSCENLKQGILFKKVRKRSWHSEEALTKALVIQAKGQPSLAGLIQKRRWEDKEGSSDCDSSYSLDSLSSAYATALTEQLRQEDFEQSADEGKSESESVDSQISQDSLVMEGSRKVTVVKSKKPKQLLSNLSYTHVMSNSGSTGEHKFINLSSTGSSTADEMPAEAYWRLWSCPKPKHGDQPEARTHLESQPETSSEHSALESKTSAESADARSVFDCSPHLFTAVEDPGSLEGLTNAQPSTENLHPPRTHEGTTVGSQLTKSTLKYSSSNLQRSMELSDGLNKTGNQPFCVIDCTDAENMSVVQELWDSEQNPASFPVVGKLDNERTPTLINEIIQQDSISCDISNFEGIPETEVCTKMEMEHTVTLEEKGQQGSGSVSSSSATDQYKQRDAPSFISSTLCFPPVWANEPFQNPESLQVTSSTDHWIVGVFNTGLNSKNLDPSSEGTTQTESTARKEEGGVLATEPHTVYPQLATMLTWDTNTLSDNDEKGTTNSVASEWSLFKQPENSLVLTDAWSSTETSGSPRTKEEAVTVGPQQASLCSSCHSSIDFSANLCKSESQPFCVSDYTDTEHMTLMHHESWDSERSADTSLAFGISEDEGVHPSTDAGNKQESVNDKVSNFEGFLETEGAGTKAEDTVTLEKSEKHREAKGSEVEHSSSGTYLYKCKDVISPVTKSHSFQPDCASVLHEIPDTLQIGPSQHGQVRDDAVLNGNGTEDLLCGDAYTSIEAKPVYCRSDANAKMTDTDSQLDGVDIDGPQPLAVSVCDRKTLDIDAEKNTAFTALSFSSKQCVEGPLSGPYCSEKNLTERSEIVLLNKNNCLDNSNTSEHLKEGRILLACAQKGKETQGERQREMQTIQRIGKATGDSLIETEVQNIDAFWRSEGLNEDENIESVLTKAHKPENDLHAKKEDGREVIHQLVKNMEQPTRTKDEVQSSERDANQSASSAVPNRSPSSRAHSYNDKRKDQEPCSTAEENAFFSQHLAASLLTDNLETEVENNSFSEELRSVILDECKDTPTHNCNEHLEPLFFMEAIGNENLSSPKLNEKEFQESHEDFSHSVQITTNSSDMKSDFKNDKLSTAMESADLLLSNYDGNQFASIHPTSVMQEGKNRFLEHCGLKSQGEGAHNPVDQRISEAVEEHLNGIMKEFVESRKDEQKLKVKSCELNTHEDKTTSGGWEANTLCVVEKSSLAKSHDTDLMRDMRDSIQTPDINNVDGHLNKTLSSPAEFSSSISSGLSHLSGVSKWDFPRGDIANAEKQDLLSWPQPSQDQTLEKNVMSDASKKNVVLSSVEHSNQDKHLEMLSNKKINYIQIENRFKAKVMDWLPVIETEELQPGKETDTNKLESDLGSEPHNIANNEQAVPNLCKNQEVGGVVAGESTKPAVFTKGASSYQAISTGAFSNDLARRKNSEPRLETVSKVVRRGSGDVCSDHSSQCQFEGCQWCHLAGRGLLNKSETQTEARYCRSVFTSDEACPAPQIREGGRNTPPHFEGNSAVLTKILFKGSPSSSDDPGTDDYLHVCMSNMAGLDTKSLQPKGEGLLRNRTLSKSAGRTDSVVTVASSCEDLSVSREPEDVRKGSTGGRLNSEHAKLPCNDSPNKVSIEYLSSPQTWPLHSDVLNFHYRDEADIPPCEDDSAGTEFATQSSDTDSEIRKSCSCRGSVCGVDGLDEEWSYKNCTSPNHSKETHDSVTGRAGNEFCETNNTQTEVTKETFGEGAVNNQDSSCEVISGKCLGVVDTNTGLTPSANHDSWVESKESSFGDKRSLKLNFIKHQYINDTNVNLQKDKSKRFKRVTPKLTSASSTESSVDLSSEENATRKVHVAKSSLTQCRSVTQKRSRQEEADRSKRAQNSVSSPFLWPLLKDDKALKACRDTGTKMAINLCTSKTGGCSSKTRDARNQLQRNGNQIIRAASTNLEKRSMVPKSGGGSHNLKQASKHPKKERVLKQEDQGLYKNNTAMHFASSDINPFVLPWQDSQEPNRGMHRHHVFGSATDISSKSSPLDVGKNRVTRCCSVDNGLSIENSPFHSHLRTFANRKGLSSTLSSIEGYKEQGSSEDHYPTSPDSQVILDRCDSCCSNSCGDLGNIASQMDELMLVCSSGPLSSATGYQDRSNLTCDQGTQTDMVDGRQKMRSYHKRASTRVQKTRIGPEGSRGPFSWESLQNMSLHLSQLIHNTSDLLGNMQHMAAKDTDNLVVEKVLEMPSGRYIRDSSTQTAVDAAVQTDGISIAVNTGDDHRAQAVKEESKHELNVIVRVFGSDVLGVSQEKKNMALNVQESFLNKRASEKTQSMPDLHLGSSVERTYLTAEAASPKFLASTPRLDMISQNRICLSPDVSPISPSDHIPEQVSSGLGTARTNSSSRQTTRLKSQTSKKHKASKHVTEGVCFTDRASSPILTVEAGVGNQTVGSESAQCFVNFLKNDLREPVEELEKQCSASALRFGEQKQPKFPFVEAKRSEERSQSTRQSKKPCDLPSFRSMSSISLENVSDFRHPCSQDSKQHNESHVPFRDRNLKNSKKSYSCPRERIAASCTSISSYSNESLLSDLRSEESASRKFQQNYSRCNTQTHSPLLVSRYPNESQTFYHRAEESVGRKSQQMCVADNCNQENCHKRSDDGGEHWSGSESLDISEGTIQYEEDDAMSVAPSECNTDLLININPLDYTQKEDCKAPEDLPMHNKFTNWSGVSGQSRSCEKSNVEQSQPAVRLPGVQQMKKSCPSSAVSVNCKTEAKALSTDRLREIERLRQEREQVMAAVRLDVNPHQLTVELTEAKLHYGLGETDALLKLLKSDSIEDPLVVPKKRELYDRHRKSIESLVPVREERATIRRARSLSPSKHSLSPGQGPDPPVRATELPSQRREYLQKLRQAVVSSTRATPPSRQAGEFPSAIELLLQDYGRAREEARTEIARARDRLRERAEQEKRRLQQQALAQLMKDDLRFRTRVSSSTLCTGSSLSLSSGPTSGYNSSNTVLLKDASRPSHMLQVSEMSKDAVAKVTHAPPIPASQSAASHRSRLSAQDVQVDHQASRFGPQVLSSPGTRGQQRTLSLSSAPSLSTYYRDVASSAVSSAISEICSAADGDLGNLLAGRSSGDWRHQGTERGVQAFYKSSSRSSAHSFMGAAELERPLPSLWCMIRDLSKAHLYHQSVSSAWTRPLDGGTQLAYLLSDCSTCHLSQPRDFCCISTESKQEGAWVMAMRSVCEESLPPPSANAVRGELLPSAWVLQPGYREGREVIRVIYLLQVDLHTPALPQRLLSTIARKQAGVIAELDAFFSL
ncbi:stAR-related lipid transfer protein 9 [Arapaima gigas]